MPNDLTLSQFAKIAADESLLEEEYFFIASGVTYTDCLRQAGYEPKLELPRIGKDGDNIEPYVINADKIYEVGNFTKFLSWAGEESPTMFHDTSGRLLDKLIDWETNHRSKEVCRKVQAIKYQGDMDVFIHYCLTAIARRTFERKVELGVNGAGFQNKEVGVIMRPLILIDKQIMPKIYEGINKVIRDSKELELDIAGRAELSSLIVSEIAPVIRKAFMESKRPDLLEGLHND